MQKVNRETANVYDLITTCLFVVSSCYSSKETTVHFVTVALQLLGLLLSLLSAVLGSLLDSKQSTLGSLLGVVGKALGSLLGRASFILGAHLGLVSF